jgi:hypothetical protein
LLPGFNINPTWFKGFFPEGFHGKEGQEPQLEKYLFMSTDENQEHFLKWNGNLSVPLSLFT